jgi:hypothetical protein
VWGLGLGACGRGGGRSKDDGSLGELIDRSQLGDWYRILVSGFVDDDLDLGGPTIGIVLDDLQNGGKCAVQLRHLRNVL